MACPILKTLQISFTPPATLPTNGYRIKWRVVGTSTYTTAVGPFIGSPAVLSNIPACENVEGTVEAICGSIYSSVATFLATKQATFVCGNNISGSSSSPVSYTYPSKLYDLQGSGDDITLSYDTINIPNRFNIYNSDNSLVVTSNWKGTASYAGPWGPTISTASTGTVTFKKSEKGGDLRWYYVTVDHAGNATTSDGWSATLTCSSTGGGGGGLPGTPTYSVTPSVSSVNEGSTVVFTINTTNVIDPSNLYYTITGTNITGSDFNDSALSGVFVINGQQGSVTKTLSNDINTEGSENFLFNVHTGSIFGPVVATSIPVIINDTSVIGSPVVPTYELVANNASSEQVATITEGSNLTINLNTTNVANGTQIPYTVTGITGADIGGNSNALTGFFTVYGNTATKNFYIENDQLTEGTETFVLSLNGLNKSVSVAITDTSLSPSWTGYNLTVISDDMDCTPVVGADPVTVYKLNDSGAILSTDVLYSAQNVGSPLTSGFYGDGTYKYTVQANGIVSNKTTCGTGVNPQASYILTSNVNSVNEGGTVIFTLSTTDVSLGEFVYYTVTGISNSDLASNNTTPLTGYFTAGEIVTKTFIINNDNFTDGPDTMTMTLDGKAVFKSVTINDTSLTPSTTYKIAVSDSYFDTTPVDCLGNTFSSTINRTTAVLQDSNGTPINAPTNITVNVRLLYTPCYQGFANNNDATITILAGQSTGTYTYTALTTVDCGQSNCVPESMSYDGVLTNSASYAWASGTTVSPTV